MATVLTQNGRNYITEKLGGTGGPSYSALPMYIGWGTGAGAASVSANALYSETGTRQAATLTAATQNVSGDTLVASATQTASGSMTFTNAGLFDAVTTGFLLMHSDLGANSIVLNTGDMVTITFRLTF